MSLLSWFRRKVTIEQAHPEYPNVHRICIDPADGSKPQELFTKKTDLFTLAWVCQAFQVLEKEKGKGPATNMRLSLMVPLQGNEEEVQNLAIPDWARSEFYKKIDLYAKSLGWKGEHFPSYPTSWRRILEDEENFES